ncbi:hypothetical protein MNEG_0499 [Monoraphidium neglectum]|uniref:FHA domain-containing protein n=1 Tax=Monoraphidium neglectum TaxID=145388 RepID=A0A0D2MY94_9CHLO|nr:hypothetical protein MNEG_0499 [Monoraphidium neglectum]KIZ07450.1 hypothetical protein MNEG_0499 [Monoraphidium neglectum]|eukprot:XP_013906469.1 hypothetical protein MNEG_0499 [Monoraphidium neglectum]
MVNGQELSPMDNVEVGVGAEITFGDEYLARFQLDFASDAPTPASSGAAAAPASGLQNSGTVVLGSEEGGS